jgi:hypothetical protein
MVLRLRGYINDELRARLARGALARGEQTRLRRGTTRKPVRSRLQAFGGAGTSGLGGGDERGCAGPMGSWARARGVSSISKGGSARSGPCRLAPSGLWDLPQDVPEQFTITDRIKE